MAATLAPGRSGPSQRRTLPQACWLTLPLGPQPPCPSSVSCSKSGLSWGSCTVSCAVLQSATASEVEAGRPGRRCGLQIISMDSSCPHGRPLQPIFPSLLTQAQCQTQGTGLRRLLTQPPQHIGLTPTVTPYSNSVDQPLMGTESEFSECWLNK